MIAIYQKEGSLKNLATSIESTKIPMPKLDIEQK
jgi:hypothetical protein